MPTDDFPIHSVLERCAAAVADRPPAAMFGLREEGFGSLYEQLVSCVLSIRTYDEVSIVAARRLFARARTPEALLALARDELLDLIQDTTFPGQKVDTLVGLSERIVTEYAGKTPADFTALTGFKGIGPKCANLALGVALDRPAISVDVHVHRITNRWGYVATKTPEQTLRALEAKLPKELWVEINRVLVPFGKHVCRGRAPRCGSCPVRADCARVGVEEGG